MVPLWAALPKLRGRPTYKSRVPRRDEGFPALPVTWALPTESPLLGSREGEQEGRRLEVWPRHPSRGLWTWACSLWTPRVFGLCQVPPGV